MTLVPKFFPLFIRFLCYVIRTATVHSPSVQKVHFSCFCRQISQRGLCQVELPLAETEMFQQQ